MNYVKKISEKNKDSKLFRWLIPALLVIIWVTISGIGGPYFGKISEVSSNDMSTFLPNSAEATKAKQQSDKFIDNKSIPAIIVFNQTGTFTAKQKSELTNLQQKIQINSAISGTLSPIIYSDDHHAGLLVVPINSSAKLPGVFTKLHKTIDAAHLDGLSYKIGGPAALTQDLVNAFSGIDVTLILVALAAVFIILLFVYRSPLLPVLVLLTAMVALSGAILVIWYLAKNGVVQLNGQVQGILFILVIGAATDYSLLYVSRLREELHDRKTKLAATIASLRGSFETIAASAGTVIAGLLCLLLSDLGSNKALGPVGGIGIVFAFLSATTFLPAVLLLIGRNAFWPKQPRFDTTKNETYEARHPFWRRIGAFVSHHPRKIWIGSLLVLLIAASGITQLKASGVPQSDIVLGKSQARDAQTLIDQHYNGGIGTPVQIIINKRDTTKLAAVLDNNNTIGSLQVASDNSPSGSMPIGVSAQTLQQNILKGIEARGVPAKQAKVAAESANPFHSATPKVRDGNVLVEATPKGATDSPAAQKTMLQIRHDAHAIDTNSLVGGITAIQYDTNQASNRDRMIIIPTVLIVITIILGLLLRSLIAPLLLLLTTIVSFAATIGISALVFNHIFHFSGADPSVILFGFIFLVALGIDYNIFLMTRVREETKKSSTRPGTIKALVVTGGVITSAGIVLASTFAALGIIPIMFLAQIAFIVAFGVLLDTIVVRSLLVPALTTELGSFVWWPSKLWRNKK